MSSPNQDPDLMRRFMNQPAPGTNPSSATNNNNTSNSPFRSSIGHKRPFHESMTPTGSPTQTLQQHGLHWPESENSSPTMRSGLFAQNTGVNSGRVSIVSGREQEFDAYTSKSRQRSLIDPEEYEQMRKQLKDVQYELSSTRTDLERKIIGLEQTVREGEIARKKLITRAESLTSDRRFLFEQDKALRVKVQQLEEESIETKTTSNEMIKDLREQNMGLKEQLSQLQEQSRAKESELSHRVRTLTASLTHQQQTLAESMGTSESQSSLAEEKHRQLTEAHSKIMELEDENRKLRQEAQGREDVGRVQKELKNQVTYIKQLEGTNRQLAAECKHFKELYRNVEVLKEEKSSLLAQLKMMDDLRVQCGMLKVQNEVMLKEKQQWAAFLEKSDATDFNSPHELAKTVASLRGDKALWTELKGELEAAVKSRDSFIGQLERQLQGQKTTILNQEEFCRQQASVARQHERSKELAQRQVQSLKEQLKSYDTEETSLMGGNYDSQRNARIEQLERQVQEYQNKLEEQPVLDSSIDSTGAINLLQSIQAENGANYSQLTKEKQELFQATQQLKHDLDLLQKENASLDNKILELELAIGAGAFNPETSRVVELRGGPAAKHQAIRQSKLDALQKENKALLAQVLRLQDSQDEDNNKGRQVEDNNNDTDPMMVPLASFNRVRADSERLETEVAEANLLLKRMKKSWNQKTDEYKDAIRSLLGYRVAFLENGRVELSSIYSEHDRQSFLFTSGQDDEGTIQLVGYGSQTFKDEHKDAFDHFVNQMQSVPAFLSSITLDYVQRQQLQEQEEMLPHLLPVQQDHHQQQYPYLDGDTQNSDMMMDM